MMQVLAIAQRCFRSCRLISVPGLLLGVFIGTAHGQYAPPGIPRPQHGQDPDLHMEQVNKWLEESRNYEDRYFRDSPYSPRAQKAVRAVKDAADGMAVATALGGGIIVLLVGLFIAKRLRAPSY